MGSLVPRSMFLPMCLSPTHPLSIKYLSTLHLHYKIFIQNASFGSSKFLHAFPQLNLTCITFPITCSLSPHLSSSPQPAHTAFPHTSVLHPHASQENSGVPNTNTSPSAQIFELPCFRV